MNARYDAKTNTYIVEYGSADTTPVYWGVDWAKISKQASPDKKFIPTRIVYNGPATIVFFPDGEKIVVKQSENDEYCRENAVAQAIVKKIFGSRSKFLKLVEKGHEQKPKEEKPAYKPWWERNDSDDLPF